MGSWADWVPFAGTIAHATASPTGIYAEDYVGCAVKLSDCAEAVDPAQKGVLELSCDKCINDALRGNIADFVGIPDYLRDVLTDIAGIVAAVKGAQLLKAGAKGGAALTGIGIALTLDGFADLYFVQKKLDAMAAAAKDAKAKYCKCPP